MSLNQDLVRRISDIERVLENLTTQENGVRLFRSTANVSNPPTDAELDAEFGTPATIGSEFVAVVDDNGAGTNLYLVYSTGSKWGYVQLTIAV